MQNVWLMFLAKGKRSICHLLSCIRIALAVSNGEGESKSKDNAMCIITNKKADYFDSVWLRLLFTISFRVRLSIEPSSHFMPSS